MKKTIKSIISLVLVIAMSFSLFTFFSSSLKSEAANSEIDLYISTNQSKYSWGDTIYFDITVTNISNNILNNVEVFGMPRYSKWFNAVDTNSIIIPQLNADESATVQIAFESEEMSTFKAFFAMMFKCFGIDSDYRKHSFDAEKKVKIGIAKLMFGFEVLAETTESIAKPENASPAEEYYWENSNVIEVKKAEKSNDVLTEKEAKCLLDERGFTDYPIIYEFSIDGEYINETEVVDDSTNKHPMYLTYFVSDSGELWTVYIIDGDVFANPASFNLESSLSASILFSESEKITSYDDVTNKFYVTIPYESAVIVKTIRTINAETLNKLTSEEISKL